MRNSEGNLFVQHRLDPVSSRTTIQEAVYLQLRQALMAGTFDPGQTMTIASLAETFGTSNMPVREALRRLAAENALEVSATGTARVPQVSLARLDDLAQARIAVEGLAMELAAPRLSVAEIALLEKVTDDQESIGRSQDIYELIAKNQDFHFILYRASGSEVLIQLIETLWLRFGPYMRLLSSSVGPHIRSGEQTAFGMHREIIAALKAGDAARARAGVENDIRKTQMLLRNYCPPEEENRRILVAQ